MIMRDYKPAVTENTSTLISTTKVFAGVLALAGMVYYILDLMVALF